MSEPLPANRMTHGLMPFLLLALSMVLPSLANAKQDLSPPTPKPAMVLPDKAGPPAETAAPSPSPDPAAGPRGQMLYENHCLGCHASVVHVRDDHRVRTIKELDHWVRRWAGELKLEWSDDEIGDVVDYLAGRYYKLK